MKKIICVFILALLLFTSLPVSGNVDHSSQQLSSTTETYEEYPNPLFSNSLVRIDITEGDVSLPQGIELVGGKPGRHLDIIISQDRLSELSSNGIDYSILINDVDSYSQSFAENYHSFAEMEQILQDISNNYPNITNLYSIGKTLEGRDIWCLEITDNPGIDEGEPGVFYMGLHHAREWPTLEICLYVANNLTSNYGVDPDITNVVNNRRLWIVPCVNPDGYHWDHDLGHDWRKNRHYFLEFGTYGVDLNRNYGGSCSGNPWGSWGAIGVGSVSHSPSSSTYCGPSAMSENETQAIRNVFLENDICASISWHTHGELVMWPWGYSSDEITPDDAYMSQVGQEVALRITTQDGTGTYTPTQSSGLYPTTGDTTDWAYGHGHYVQGRPTFAYTIEACDSFHPNADVLDQICAENFDGALYLLQEAENIDKVLPRVLPPKIDEMSVEANGSYTVSWQEQNSDAKPDHFQLDELTNLLILTDNAESGSELWVLDGFSMSDSKSDSTGGGCYKSRSINSDVSSMVTTYPIPIEEGMTLSFWCWYNIEENYDMAFIEVSRDGRAYDLLDKFTGSSNDWAYKEYSLDDYSGESVYMRFRYTTDAATSKDGFYVDDIYPVADFNDIVTISDSITDNCYGIDNKEDGIYYYVARGYNAEHSWGDFSTLKKIQVAVNDNEPPTIPSIIGPTSGKAGKEYEYAFTAIDPEGDDVCYYIKWGDGSVDDWIGPYESNEVVKLNHMWSGQGNYTMLARARDIHNVMGDWGTLEIAMPKNKRSINPLIIDALERIIEHFPFLERLIQPQFYG